MIARRRGINRIAHLATLIAPLQHHSQAGGARWRSKSLGIHRFPATWRPSSRRGLAQPLPEEALRSGACGPDSSALDHGQYIFPPPLQIIRRVLLASENYSADYPTGSIDDGARFLHGANHEQVRREHADNLRVGRPTGPLLKRGKRLVPRQNKARGMAASPFVSCRETGLRGSELDWSVLSKPTRSTTCTRINSASDWARRYSQYGISSGRMLRTRRPLSSHKWRHRPGSTPPVTPELRVESTHPKTGTKLRGSPGDQPAGTGQVVIVSSSACAHSLDLLLAQTEGVAARQISRSWWCDDITTRALLAAIRQRRATCTRLTNQEAPGFRVRWKQEN